MVIVFDAQEADTPAGKPFAPDTFAFEMPVAPVVLCVMFVKTVLTHNVGLLDATPAVLFGVIVIKAADELAVAHTPLCTTAL